MTTKRTLATRSTTMKFDDLSMLSPVFKDTTVRGKVKVNVIHEHHYPAAPARCPVLLFQTSNTRSEKKQRKRKEDSKLKAQKERLHAKSGAGDFMGVKRCPTALFLAPSVIRENNLCMLPKAEDPEDIKLEFETRELNQASKESRLDWLIDAVGGERKSSVKGGKTCAVTTVDEHSCCYGFGTGIGRALRKLFNRGRVSPQSNPEV